MERLTYDFCLGDIHCWQVKGADNRECRQVCEEQEENGCKGCPIALAFDRLAAYEDTGLTPEEVQKMRWIPVEERPLQTHRRKPMKTNTKAKFILITVVFVLITTIVLGVCPLPIYWKIPVMFLVLASEYMAVMMGYMCKEGDDD